MKILLISIFVTVFQLVNGLESENGTSGNHLRVALPGREDSDPTLSKRYSFRSDGEFLSVYEKGPVYPGMAGIREQFFFISEDYTVYDGSRERLIQFFDPEQWMNCDCDHPFPPELDIPHRFAIYHPVTVQAPLPSVPKNLDNIKYTGYYYACPAEINPYEFSWYLTKPSASTCKWIWYQSINDAPPQIQPK